MQDTPKPPLDADQQKMLAYLRKAKESVEKGNIRWLGLCMIHEGDTSSFMAHGKADVTGHDVVGQLTVAATRISVQMLQMEMATARRGVSPGGILRPN